MITHMILAMKSQQWANVPVTQETSLCSKQEVDFLGPRCFKPRAITTAPRILITRGKVASTEKKSPGHSGKRGGKLPRLAAIPFAVRTGNQNWESTHGDSVDKMDLAAIVAKTMNLLEGSLKQSALFRQKQCEFRVQFKTQSLFPCLPNSSGSPYSSSSTAEGGPGKLVWYHSPPGIVTVRVSKWATPYRFLHVKPLVLLKHTTFDRLFWATQHLKLWT